MRIEKSAGGQAQAAVTSILSVVWVAYRLLFQDISAKLVPCHTRDACFQLFSDLRSNVPKDKKFLKRHANSFHPQSWQGWLAVTAVAGYAVSGIAVLSSITLAVCVAGVWSALGLLTLFVTFVSSFLAMLTVPILASSALAVLVAGSSLFLYGGVCLMGGLMHWLLHSFGLHPEHEHDKFNADIVITEHPVLPPIKTMTSPKTQQSASSGESRLSDSPDKVKTPTQSHTLDKNSACS